MPVNLMPVSAADSTALSDESIVGGDGGVDETGVSNSRARLERPLARPAGPRTDYDGHFRAALDRLHSERRYRVFADIERISGRFPQATWRRPEGGAREITVWCSNDYLGMGQHPEVVGALTQTAAR